MARNFFNIQFNHLYHLIPITYLLCLLHVWIQTLIFLQLSSFQDIYLVMCLLSTIYLQMNKKGG